MPDTVVRLIKNWSWPDLCRQTPGNSGRWGDVRFVMDGDGPCDYAVTLNFAPENTSVTCPPEHVWLLVQEPPNEHFKSWHHGAPVYARVFTSDATLNGARYVHDQPALPWHVNRDYDTLKAAPPPDKPRMMSCITSAKAIFDGHRKRLRFLADIRRKIEFDIFGRGFASVADKWDVLAPYRYAIVVENFVNPLYWSEKLADALLAWTVPIYVGCTDIGRWFPKEAIIAVDMDDPDAVEKIRAAIADEKAWRARVDAVAEARRLILDQYNIFPFLTGQITTNTVNATAAQRLALPKAAS